ncbi:KEOPS complex subunit Pcc1 [Pyrococcus yayanosii]|uniref:KEOPS complex Pcc1-like subunit n=1 Tax=Pyrococcus yayanosii (strain CH1 / JCM 16557) TaxID=529709 RepID=F8AI26_PYRYC|nr:KEOPS complex subunit Pcc1 [Pyrococcus yayanosii]AEH25494.1 hypothetical protein PYCH_18390 [Pyrococcus yayanosii CH1]
MKPRKIEGRLVLEFPSEDVAKVVYQAVLYEHLTVPYRRSEIEFRLDGRRIVIELRADDSSALRGTLNSYLRWIKVAIDAVEI